MPMTDAEKAALLQEAVAADLAEQAGSYAPANGPNPAVSTGFAPMVPPSDKMVVSTEKYLSPTAGGNRLGTMSGLDALPVMDEDMAVTKGMRRESYDPVSRTATYVKDEAFAKESALRRNWEAYAQEWHIRALKREPGYSGNPYSPATYRKFIEAGLDPWPVVDAPTPVDPTEQRIRDLEATVARLEGMTAKLPR
jgi:hypothetical protein